MSNSSNSINIFFTRWLIRDQPLLLASALHREAAPAPSKRRMSLEGRIQTSGCVLWIGKNGETPSDFAVLG